MPRSYQTAAWKCIWIVGATPRRRFQGSPLAMASSELVSYRLANFIMLASVAVQLPYISSARYRELQLNEMQCETEGSVLGTAALSAWIKKPREWLIRLRYGMPQLLIFTESASAIIVKFQIYMPGIVYTPIPSSQEPWKRKEVC